MSILDYFCMPGTSFKGNLNPLTKHEVNIRNNLANHIYSLAYSIGERHSKKYKNLQLAITHIKESFLKTKLEIFSQKYLTINTF